MIKKKVIKNKVRNCKELIAAFMDIKKSAESIVIDGDDDFFANSAELSKAKAILAGISNWADEETAGLSEHYVFCTEGFEALLIRGCGDE